MATGTTNHAKGFEYVLGLTPSWANGNPSVASGICYRDDNSCVLPLDVLDTSPTCNIPSAVLSGAGLQPGNCQVQEFLFSLVESLNPSYDDATGTYRCAAPGCLQIQRWSPWNEVNLKQFVNPPCQTSNSTSCQQIARIARDMWLLVKWVDPSAIVATPSFSARSEPKGSTQSSAPAHEAAYLSTNALGFSPGTYADVFDHHCYSNNGLNDPEDTDALETAFDTVRNQYMPGKDTWCDEGSWGENVSVSVTLNPNPDCTSTAECIDATSINAVNYTLIEELMLMNHGEKMFNWYGGGAGEWGALATFNTPTGCTASTCSLVPTDGETARLSLSKWTIGADIQPGFCVQNGTAWTCTIPDRVDTMVKSCYAPIATPAAYHAVIKWDSVTPSKWNATAAGYTHYCTWDGSRHVATTMDAIGRQPVLWESP